MISHSDSENAASRDVKHGPGVWIALAVTVLVLVALLGVPGFIAAELSKRSAYVVSVNGEVTDVPNPPGMALPANVRAQLILLAPANWLASHSETMHRFYNWEFHVAGGVEIVVTD